MKAFLGSDFLLETATAQKLYNDYATTMPIIDYHCHISPKEVYEDRRFNNLTEIWLGGRQPDGSYVGDHYKWRLMRSNGVDEELVTGDGDAFARFRAFVKTLEMAPGNPMYHWCHMELRKYFGFEGYLNSKNAGEVWRLCNDKLQNDPALTARGIIEQSNVTFIGTTDDPADDLQWHIKTANDPSVKFKMSPSFRPDKALDIRKSGFSDYMSRLAESAGKKHLGSFSDVCEVLNERLEFFVKNGCRASDHGFEHITFRIYPEAEINTVYNKAITGKPVTREEEEAYQSALMLHLGREYHRLGVVMQLHYSCLRNVNQRQFTTLGADTGFDMISDSQSGEGITALLSALDADGRCPKTVFYNLNPADNEKIGSLIGCFQSGGIPGKIQHGSAWWFNDTKDGMEKQLRSLASLSLLGNFIGMLTDSRSFLSYTRHDYFRRIFCNLLGNWVDNGEYPNDSDALKNIVEAVCYNNAARYFNLD